MKTKKLEYYKYFKIIFIKRANMYEDSWLLSQTANVMAKSWNNLFKWSYIVQKHDLEWKTMLPWGFFISLHENSFSIFQVPNIWFF
jgi:hypothetical protein